MRMLGYLMGTERLAGGWLIPSSAAMGSWRPWGPLGLRGSEQGTARRAGQVAGGDVLWTLGLGACGPEGVNSQPRLWVPGARVRLWLLSHRNFPGLRCCLDSPAEGKQLSQAGRPGTERLVATSVGPVGTAGVWRGQDSRDPQGHLPCSPWPRPLRGALCVLGGQRPPGRIWRNRRHVPWMLAGGQGSGGAGGSCLPSHVGGAHSWGAGPHAAPGELIGHGTCLCLLGSQGQAAFLVLLGSQGSGCRQHSGASGGLRGRTPPASDSLAQEPPGGLRGGWACCYGHSGTPAAA